MSKFCKVCGKMIEPIEIALSRKLINRDGTQLYCIQCLSEHFETDRQTLLKKAEQFRLQGCTLFEEIIITDFLTDYKSVKN